MAGPTGLEPATSYVTGRRSNQLSYDPKLMWCRGALPIRIRKYNISWQRLVGHVEEGVTWHGAHIDI